MAVYTVLDREEVESFIKPFGIGPLIEFKGVAAGIENTNYFVTTDQSDFPSEFRTAPTQHYVLTIFEAIDAQELSFYIDLTTLLNTQELPVPCPIKDVNGVALQQYHHKPALLIPKIQGQHPDQPDLNQCQQMATTLAQLHLSCLEAKLEHRSSHDLAWVERCANTLKPELDQANQELLAEIPRFHQRCQHHPDLPQAVIHGDLFRDNVLFDNGQLSAIIDFNSAGTGYLMFDLAVLVNDWCSEPDGSLNPLLTAAVVKAYQQQRPFTDDEKTLWPDFLRIAAARFWVSRLHTQLHPDTSHRPGGLVEPKDPQQYRNILLQRIHSPLPIN